MTGSGTLADPYVIWDVVDLQNMQLNHEAYYELGQDINASATSTWNWDGSNYLGFMPVGYGGFNHFWGNFDGKGFKITGLYINRPTMDDVGLFGYIDDWHLPSCFRNVTLVSVNITGKNAVGALVGLAAVDGSNSGSGIITNCHSSGTVTGQASVGGLIGEIASLLPNAELSSCSSSVIVTGVIHVGGLLGHCLDYCKMDHCFATGTVTGTSERAGGFVGCYHAQSGYANGPSATDCYATGDVTGVKYVGGFAGYSGYTSTCPIATFSRCYATGVVNASGQYAGGFVGYCNYRSDFDQCYSTGNTTGTDFVGGFVGFTVGTNTTLSDCYAFGSATATGGRAGGFVGYNQGMIDNCYAKGLVSASSPSGFCSGGTTPSIRITNCFWDTEMSGQATSAGGTGKTSGEMNHIDLFLAAGWDFNSIWNINRVSTVKAGSITSGSAVLEGFLDLTIINDAYPFLRWQTIVELPCNCGFEWGETQAFGNFTPVSSKNTGDFFTTQIASGLKPQTIYYYRARALSSPGPIHGGTKTFTTLVGFEVETLPATNITENSARIWGRVRKVPVTAMARFDWGGNIEYGAQTPWAQGLVSDDMFYYDLTNLAEGRAYHFRAMAMGSALVYGNDMTFTTRSPVGPVVLIQEELAHLMEVS